MLIWEEICLSIFGVHGRWRRDKGSVEMHHPFTHRDLNPHTAPLPPGCWKCGFKSCCSCWKPWEVEERLENIIKATLDLHLLHYKEDRDRQTPWHVSHEGPDNSSLLHDFLLPKAAFSPRHPNLAASLKIELLIAWFMLTYSLHLIRGITKSWVFSRHDGMTRIYA